MNTELTEQIRDYFADLGYRQGAVDVVANLERAESSIHTLDRSITHRPAVGIRWWVASITAAAVVAALVAGLVLVDVLPTDDGTSPVTTSGQTTTSPVTTTGETITPMRLVEQAVTPSSIGDVRWTVLEAFVPAPDGPEWRPNAWQTPDVWRGPTGYAFVSVQAGTLVVSDDLASWRAVALPMTGRVLGLSTGSAEQFRLMLRTPEGSIQYWESPDLETWSLVDEPDYDYDDFADWIDGPGLLAAHMDPYIDLPNGAVLSRVSIDLDFGQLVRRVADDEQRRFFDERAAEMWWVQSDTGGLSGTAGVAVITSTSWRTWTEAKAGSPAAVEFEVSISGTPDAWVVEVVDPVTGESLGTVRGSRGAADLQSTLTALVTSGFEEWFVIDGDTAEPVQPDWAAPSDPPDALPVTFATTGNGLLAYRFADWRDTGTPEIWRTTDGRSWEHMGSATGWLDAGHQLQQILTAPGGGLLAVLYHDTGRYSFLTSDDGFNWVSAGQSPASDFRVVSTERGFVLLGFGPERFTVWTSPDGRAWEPVEATELILANMAGGYESLSSGSSPNSGLITVTSYAEEGRAVIWIIDVG